MLLKSAETLKRSVYREKRFIQDFSAELKTENWVLQAKNNMLYVDYSFRQCMSSLWWFAIDGFE